MSLTVQGIIALEELLVLRLGTTNRRRVVAKLFDQADRIALYAQQMAPHQTGALERAIKVRPERGSRQRDALGRFIRTEVEVYIDADAPGEDKYRPELTIGRYAYYAHELLEPAGPNQLGAGSIAKQEGSGVQVGGGFLDRAVALVENRIEIELLEAFDDL